ncbi:hypothetical protein LIER_11853 [Lithospermum erythrorhizon]|uniref:Uncharacterized protein n=1 Tax=Lithospermum erythrorhizon TaxID=34254 RepID=A0AAV3PR09_LITER
MAFYKRLRYDKLKNALVLETPLSKDQLTARVKQYVELEELKSKETNGKDLRDVLTRKRARSKSLESSLYRKGSSEIGSNPSKGDNMIPNRRRVWCVAHK